MAVSWIFGTHGTNLENRESCRRGSSVGLEVFGHKTNVHHTNRI